MKKDIRVIVTGGRHYVDEAFLYATLDKLHVKYRIAALAHGGATGADALAGQWAMQRKIRLVHVYEANWRIFGKSAGPMRNVLMLTQFAPDLVVAFPGGIGTANMRLLAKAHHVKVMNPAARAPHNAARRSSS